MKVIELAGDFGFDRLRVAERPLPRCGPGEVRIRMQAASINYRDVMMVRGEYNPRQPLPLVPLSDGVGVIDGVGDGVPKAWEGRRVAGLFAQTWHAGRLTRDRLRSTLGGPLDGVLAEWVVLPWTGVAAVPEHLSAIEAATLPCAALTAWSALVTFGRVCAGQTVLVLGTGGVSMFALDFAALHGARTIVTSSSDDKLAIFEERGAWRTINYRRTKNWGKAVRELTDGLGVDHVVEVGGVGTMQQSLHAVRTGGTISLIGVLGGATAPLDLTPALMQGIRIQGVFVGHREAFEAMCRAIATHRVRPRIDRVFSFARTREALEYVASGSHCGKVCVSFEEPSSGSVGSRESTTTGVP